ncbi:MAG TPA: 3-methyl-2-oxobutanoate hydroxymethyltransferase [Gammaproteobacteria bacterium]|nr:3-methyl-2-oxobutanoate hydroxymethyltransferase [Gammaproteobacteria bacterium]
MYTKVETRAGDKPVTISQLAKMKKAGEKIACLTAYDASFAALLDAAGVDVVLVGDTLGMVVQGHPSTVPVTVDDMIYHCRMVSRGLRRALLMADMPFLSYPEPREALENAGRLMREGGAAMVKLEANANQAEVVRHLAANGVPVCAHLGLRPQSVHKIGGFKVQGKDEAAARQMIDDALALEAAGADIILLECVPSSLGREITERVSAPVIGIGAGPDTDGQILVLYDMLDITPGHRPRFAKNFMADAESPKAAVEAYVRDVSNGAYPAPEHCFD